MAKWPRKNDLGEDGTCLVSASSLKQVVLLKQQLKRGNLKK